MLRIVLIVIVAALAANSIVIIKPVRYGVVLRFKKRTGRIITEGLNFILPLIESVEVYDYRLEPRNISLSFFSKDNLEVILRFMVQWRPDFRIKNRVGKNRFIENTEDTIVSGVSDAIRSNVGNIIGQVNANTFVADKKAVGRYIDCILRLKFPPHVRPSLVGGPQEEEIKDVAERVKFYKEYSAQINELLRKEKEQVKDYSEIEERYGIDIEISELSEVTFSDKTKAALELKKQTEEKLRADEEEKNKKLSMAKELKEFGLSPQEAINAAEVVLDQAKKEIRSFEGLDKLKDLINVKIGS